MIFLHIKNTHKKDGEKLFTKVCSGRIWGSGFKLKEGRFVLDIEKTCFTMHKIPWLPKTLYETHK